MARTFNFHYRIDASSYYNRAVICLQKAFNLPDGSYLFYASLELRNCIERFLFEYLIIIKTDDRVLKKYLKEYRIKNISGAIKDVEPEFYKKLEFTNFYLSAIGQGFQVPIPDTEKLNGYYGKLGNYLHHFNQPINSTNNQEWWNTLIQLIEETRAYLFQFFESPRAFFKMNERGLIHYEDYKKGIIPKEEIAKKILVDYY